MRVNFSADLPKGVDVDKVVAQLGPDRVAVLDPDARLEYQGDLADLVASADAHGKRLSVVVLPTNDRHDSQLRDLATAVGKQESGTVLVLSPNWIGTYSDAVSRFDLEAAEDYARPLTAQPVQSAEAFVGRLERPAAPWTAGVLAALVLLVALLAGLYVLKARRG